MTLSLSVRPSAVKRADIALRMRRRLERVEAIMVANMDEVTRLAVGRPCECVRVISHEKGLTLTIVRCKRCQRLKECMKS